jgi:hypothetical protein
VFQRLGDSADLAPNTARQQCVQIMTRQHTCPVRIAISALAMMPRISTENQASNTRLVSNPGEAIIGFAYNRLDESSCFLSKELQQTQIA